MENKFLSSSLAGRLAGLYERMESAYDRVAGALDFGCDDCPDNCCDSYFLHHTMIEWHYLHRGLAAIKQSQREVIRGRAEDYLRLSREQLEQGERPVIMCPLNEAGRCSLYRYRLMICRMHGVPSLLKRPDGQTIHFPGCFRCQELTRGLTGVAEVDRTGLYVELAGLEREFLLAGGVTAQPRIRKTIAEMIVEVPSS